MTGRSFIQAIVIDPYAQEIRLQWVQSATLQDYYDAIGMDCSCFESTHRPFLKGEDMLYCDEEGLLRSLKRGFTTGNNIEYGIMGRALIVGTDDEGNTIAPTTLIGDLRGQIQWLV